MLRLHLSRGLKLRIFARNPMTVFKEVRGVALVKDVPMLPSISFQALLLIRRHARLIAYGLLQRSGGRERGGGVWRGRRVLFGHAPLQLSPRQFLSYVTFCSRMILSLSLSLSLYHSFVLFSFWHYLRIGFVHTKLIPLILSLYRYCKI